MLKPLACILLIAAQPAVAANWSYDFGGTLSDHFEHVETTAPTSATSQIDGKLLFYIPATPTPRETSEVFLFKDAAPSVLQDWTARVEVVVPQALNEQTPRNGSINAWAAASLMAFTSDMTKAAYIGLEADGPGKGSIYDAAAFDVLTGADLAAASRRTTDGSATLSLSFDATAKTITATDPQGMLLVMDVNSWHLTATDTLRIGIVFDTRNMTVPVNQAMTLDNFVLTAVPEPEIYLQLLAGLGLIGFAVRRRSV